MLYSRVCVFIFRRRRRRWDHIFLEGNIFCWWSCCVLTMFAVRSLVRLRSVYECDKALLCAFLCLRIESRRKNFPKHNNRSAMCVCGWVVFVSLHGGNCPLCWWKSPFAFFFWTIGKFNFHFSATQHSISKYFKYEYKNTTTRKVDLKIFRDQNIASFALKQTRLMTPSKGEVLATFKHFHGHFSTTIQYIQEINTLLTVFLAQSSFNITN